MEAQDKKPLNQVKMGDRIKATAPKYATAYDCEGTVVGITDDKSIVVIGWKHGEEGKQGGCNAVVPSTSGGHWEQQCSSHLPWTDYAKVAYLSSSHFEYTLAESAPAQTSSPLSTLGLFGMALAGTILSAAAKGTKPQTQKINARVKAPEQVNDVAEIESVEQQKERAL